MALSKLEIDDHILTNNIKFRSVTLNICHEQGAIRLLDFAVSALEEKIGDLQEENHLLASRNTH